MLPRRLRRPPPSRRGFCLGDPATTMGPLNNQPVAARMDVHMGDAVARGATVATSETILADHLDR